MLGFSEGFVSHVSLSFFFLISYNAPLITCFVLRSNNKLSFITNNVKGIQSLKKRLKLIQYFKSKIGSCGLLFLQETHSNSKVEQKWK